MGWRFLQGAFGILAAGFLIQAQAQHGHASASSAHIAGPVHAGPSFSGGSRRFAPARPQPSRNAQTRHPGNGGRGGVGYRRRYPYIYGDYGLMPFGYGLPLPYALPYGNDEDDTTGPGQAMNEYGPEPPQMAANAPPAFRPPYQPQGEAAPANAQPSTTLIFKDGRAPLQVHNYALTSSTLYALDGESRQDIPLSLLDVPATVAANRAAGVDFALPVNR